MKNYQILKSSPKSYVFWGFEALNAGPLSNLQLGSANIYCKLWKFIDFVIVDHFEAAKSFCLAVSLSFSIFCTFAKESPVLWFFAKTYTLQIAREQFIVISSPKSCVKCNCLQAYHTIEEKKKQKIISTYIQIRAQRYGIFYLPKLTSVNSQKRMQ